MGIQIHELTALNRAPQTGDVLAVDTGATTNKVDYSALRGAVLTDAVRTDDDQNLTDAQKAQAIENIGAATQADVTAIGDEIGDTTLPTTAQTITGAIAEVANGAVRYDIAQSLTSSEQIRARNNIGAANGAEQIILVQNLAKCLRFTEQTLTESQKTQARTNIGAASETDTDALETLVGNTTLPTTAQTVTGAIAEHETDISNINSAIGTVPSGSNLQGEVDDLKSAIGDVENALLVTANGFVGGGERIFNVTSGTSHSAVKGFWPVQIKSGAGFTVEVKSTAITGYQLYAYYGDGTSEKIYSGTSFKNAFTASKAITSFGFYIGSTFVTSSGTVEADLVITDGFYDTTVKMSDTVDMVYGHVGEISKTWAITSGTAISAGSHEVAVEINTGETFSIGVMCKPYGALTAVQYYLMYADGTNERIFSSSYSLIYRGIAKKKVSAVRLSVGATGVTATGTCTITIKKLDDTVIAREIAELNKDSAIKAINHRGYNTAAPENTIPAFILSYKAGFKYVETDIRLTSDGVPVLLHDASINRTARNADGTELSSTVNIADITYEEALEYDYGVWKGAQFAGTKIPTFREFIMLCKRLSLHPYIEIESSVFTEAQVQGLVDIVIACGMKDKVTWASQSNTYLGYVSTYCPKCRLGLVVFSITETNVGYAATLKTDDNEVFITSNSITSEEIALCIDEDIPLEYWTEDVEATAGAIDPYISGITSDIINVVEYYTDRVLATGTAVWN